MDSNNVLESKNKEINSLKEQLKESKIIIEQLNNKIQELKTQLNHEKNKSLNEIKENNIILKKNELNYLKVKLQNIYISNQKEKIIKGGDKCVNFVSSDYKIQFAIPCLGNSTFAEVEELFEMNNFLWSTSLMTKFEFFSNTPNQSFLIKIYEKNLIICES